MLDALTITEAEAAGLSELAALDLAMARDFAARAQDERDPQTANDLARSYQRMARSYRQSLALKVRLAREMAQSQRDMAERDARETPPPPDPRAARRRADELSGAVTRVLFTEYEGPEREDDRAFVLDWLETSLVAEMADPGFAHRPLEEQVAELCDDLGLSADLAARWRDLPDPDAPVEDPDKAPADGPAWRGSG